MTSTAGLRLVGLAAAVHEVVASADGGLELDRVVGGEVRTGRGGMVCNTLAVAAALGVRTGGVVAVGDDVHGAALRKVVQEEGIDASFVLTPRTPMTVTVASGTTRSSIMGAGGVREPDLDPAAVSAAWDALPSRPTWALLTLPALDSPAGERFVALARRAGSAVAVTLSSVEHVLERAPRLGRLLAAADLVFANADETSAAGVTATSTRLLLTTSGAGGATASRPGSRDLHVPVASPVTVVDATGAGDAFAAGVLSALDPRSLSDPDLASAMRLGHLAAGVVVSRLGAQPGPEGAALLRTVGASHGLR